MSGSSAFGVAVLMLALGAAFWLLIPLLTRAVTRLRPQAIPKLPPATDGDEALVVVRPGGKVEYLNPQAVRLFQMSDEDAPNLEWLARQMRPTDRFIQLCAGEGSGAFTIHGRLVHAQSFYVYSAAQPVMAVILRPQESETAELDGGGSAAQTLQTIAGMGQSMAASLDLDETMRAVLVNVRRLIPADYFEITLWDVTHEELTPYRLIGQLDDARLEPGRERYRSGEGYSGHLIKTRAPLAVPDTDANSQLTPASDRHAFPVHSYIGVPLMVSTELIGTLEVGALQRDALQADDLNLLQLISGQAAVAVHNALLYRAEKHRLAELSGLARMAQALGSAREPGTLFARLVEAIHPLFNVEIIGFLILNENTRTLEGQAPFHGLPEQFVQIYRTSITPNSPAESALLSQDVIMSENAADDTQWEVLELGHLAQAASLRESVLVPLTSGGRMMGYLQASNHCDGLTSFSSDELRLLMIVANQAAAIIENAMLVQQSRQRAMRAEALRRVASLASSAANLDEILKFSIQELARLLQADVAGVLLVDETQGLLGFHEASVMGDLPRRAPALRTDDPQFPFTATGSQRAWRTGSAEQAIVPFYHQVLQMWSVNSAVVVPLVVRDIGIGEIWFGSREAEFFDQGDLQVVTTAAGQLAGVVEQSTLTAQTDESLRRRVEQMTALTRITRELSTSLDFNYLLQMVYDEALRTTRADCGTILLFDLNRAAAGQLVVRYFVGDSPEDISDMEAQVIQRRQAVYLPDVRQSDLPAPHDEVLSALIVPIYYQEYPAGLMLLHGKALNRFDASSVEIAQSLAAQAAVALGNALQYEEQIRRGELLKRELETLARLFQVTKLTRTSQPLEQILTSIAEAIREATPFQTVVISLVDEGTDTLRRVSRVGLSAEKWEELSSVTQSWRVVQQLLLPEYRIGNMYYIPAHRRPSVPEAIHSVRVLPVGDRRDADGWDSGDLFLAPLYDSEGKPMGLVSVDAPRDNCQPDRPTYEAMELFAMQAAMMIVYHRRLTQLENAQDELSTSNRRLQESAQNAITRLPALLHRELEQTITIQKLHRQLGRFDSALQIAQIAARENDPAAVVRVVARELITRLGMQVALIGEQTPDGPQILESIGNLPEGVLPEALFGQRNPLRQMLADGVMPLVADLTGNSEWSGTPLLTALDARSLIGLHLPISPARSLGILALGKRALPGDTEEDRLLFEQLARQVSAILQNLELIFETRRHLKEMDQMLAFSRKLGSLDPSSILQTLVESAVEAVEGAQCGWVAMWGERAGGLNISAALGYPDTESLLQIQLTVAESVNGTPLPLRAYQTGQPILVSDVDFARDYTLTPDDLLLYRHATNGRAPLTSLAVPLAVGDTPLGVLVLDNFATNGAMDEESVSLAFSLARQTALALENARLFVSSEDRARQLHSLTQVSGALTASLHSRELLGSLLQLLGSVVPFATATLWLRAGQQVTVADALGFSDSESRIGLSVSLEDSALFQAMLQSHAPERVPDVRADARFPALIEPDHLSWLGVPLIAKDDLVGVIALEKTEADFYTADHLQAAMTFASQAAVALENARLFEESQSRAAELDQRSQRLALLNRLSAELGASLDVDTILTVTARQLTSALGLNRVAALMLDEQGGLLLQSETPAQPDETLPRSLPFTDLLEHLRESQGIFSSADVSAEPELAGLREAYLAQRLTRSLCIVPLISAGSLHGWLLLQNDGEYRFSLPEIELARTMCNQAAVAVQNARLFAETRRLTADLEQRVTDRTAELRREHRNSQALLRIITELTTSLDMNQVLNRTLAVLNETFGAEQSLILLAQDSTTTYQAGGGLVSLENSRKAPVWLEKEVMNRVIKERSAALVEDMHADVRWTIAPDQRPEYRSLMALPLVLGEDVLGALMLFHHAPGTFAAEQANLLEAASRQIAVALNNAELFKLIRDQAERLGGMLREQQIDASRSRAILEAVADGVLVTNPQNRIDLFNASAGDILGLDAYKVPGQPLDAFSGLFGKAGRVWLNTIRRWGESKSAAPSGEKYTEQLELENGRIVQVSLAPVFWRSSFLGTVSIFRDVTREVEVDRMKSEFVANVSHELRTPLTSIKGYVEVMLMGAAGAITAQQEHFLQVVRENALRLGVLVEDLLDISRVETGNVRLTMERLELLPMVQSVAADFRKRSEQENKPLELQVNVPEDLPAVLGDAERVRQVIYNLLMNGYNYTPAGGRVALRAVQVGHDIQVDVVDNGVGIAPEVQGRIFERFYRGEDPLVLATAGTGLGLAMARVLVEMHKGRIWFTSEGIPGRGSVFSFTLPVYSKEE